MGMTANLLKVSKEKLTDLQTDPALIGALVMDAIQGNLAADDCLDLYKSWDALHALLKDGEFGPEADAVMGGTPIGEDLGYGPSRILDEDQVAKIAAALTEITKSDFESRFDVEKMEDVYSFHPEDAENEWPVLSELFEELKSFYARAAEQSCAVVLYLV